MKHRPAGYCDGILPTLEESLRLRVDRYIKISSHNAASNHLRSKCCRYHPKSELVRVVCVLDPLISDKPPDPFPEGTKLLAEVLGVFPTENAAVSIGQIVKSAVILYQIAVSSRDLIICDITGGAV